MVRVKNRYIFGEVLLSSRSGSQGQNLTASIFLKSLKQNLQEIFGDFIQGKADGWLNVLHYNPDTRFFVLRTPRDVARQVWGGLTMIHRFETCQVSIRVVGISGSMRSLLKKTDEYISQVIIGSRHAALPHMTRLRIVEKWDDQKLRLRTLGKF